jgi:hypothetical protein
MINHPRRSRARATAAVALADHDHDADFASLLASVSATFGAGGALFTTNAADLFDLYLKNLPAEQDVHTCTACRRFVETFGGLVSIGDDGHAASALWCSEDAPPFYRAAIKAMQSEVQRARVTGPFLSNEPRYGMPKTGAWTHFSVTPPRSALFKHGLLSPGQAMAAKREDFRTVASALGDFTPPVLTEALRLLESESLARSERFVSPVRWMLDLHTARAAARDARVRDNILWRAIAAAPDGYCHPRASVVGTLLEDIASGLDFAEVKRRFDAKLHPLQYQRPQAAPAAGAIAAAEKVVEVLGIAPSLERRFARLDDIDALWVPDAPKTSAPAGGVFGHLKPKDHASAPMAAGMPPVTMTWEKFARTVLPGAVAMEVQVPAHGNFIGMTTAVHADAPPILRWDREDDRNPVAWYVYHGGSPAAQWGLRGNTRANVAALSLLPTMWGQTPAPHLGEGVIIVIEGALDTRNEGNCLFPETLRDELHGARAVIEAYSKRAQREPPGGPAACGLDMRKGGQAGYVLRVTSATGKTDYRIDRWD